MSKRRSGRRPSDRPGTPPPPSPTARPIRAQGAPAGAKPGRGRSEPPPPVPTSRRWAIGVPVVAGLAALALYVRTLSPSVATGDSGELTTVAATLGLAHPPGYPTFTILGHLATLLPIGDVAFRLNLFSAALDALAIGLATFVGGRLIAMAGGGTRLPEAVAWLAALAGGLGLALSSAFWRVSIVAEVFALNNVLALALLTLVLEWAWRPSRVRLLWAAGLAAGIGLTNQQTIAFVAPGLLVLLALGFARAEEAARRAGVLARPWFAAGPAILLGLAGLLPYLYLPLAAASGAAPVWGDPRSLTGFIGIVARSAYGTFSLTAGSAAGAGLEHVGLFGGYLVGAFTWPGIALAAVGITWLAVRRPLIALALTLWIVIAGPVFLLLANPSLADPVTRGVLERFYVLPSLVVGPLMAVGLWRIADWLVERVSSRPAGPVGVPRWLGIGVAGLALVGLLAVAATRIGEVDLSSDRVAGTYARDLLGPLPENSVLLMRSDENYTSVAYAQQVEAFRPDVIAIDVELLKIESYVSWLKGLHPDIDIPFAQYDGGVRTHLVDLVDNVRLDRPVYLAGTLVEDISGGYDLVDEGLAKKLVPAGDGRDALADLRSDPGIFERLHAPSVTYPPTTWEAAIAAHYADVAFRTGVALQVLGPQANHATVERFYRAAIRISPTLATAWKNLGILLSNNGGSAADIVSAYEHYLALVPDDPEAGAIRSTIERIRGGASPAP